MAIHGKDTTVLYNATDLSTYFNDLSLNNTVDTNQCTTFSDSSHQYIVGTQDGTVSASGYWDGSSATTVDAILQATLGNQSSDSTVTDGHLMALNKTQAYADNVRISRVDTTNYSVTSAVADVVSISADFQSSDGLDIAVLLIPSTVDSDPDSGTFTGTVVDVGGASSSTGAIAQMNIISNAVSANTTVKIKHSTASSGTYTDLVTFTTVGSDATVSERKTVASGSTINRYMKVVITSSAAGALNLAIALKRL
jgi:hypothetical protein